jgi:hypothetical protein
MANDPLKSWHIADSFLSCLEQSWQNVGNESGSHECDMQHAPRQLVGHIREVDYFVFRLVWEFDCTHINDQHTKLSWLSWYLQLNCVLDWILLMACLTFHKSFLINFVCLLTPSFQALIWEYQTSHGFSSTPVALNPIFAASTTCKYHMTNMFKKFFHHYRYVSCVPLFEDTPTDWNSLSPHGCVAVFSTWYFLAQWQTQI